MFYFEAFGFVALVIKMVCIYSTGLRPVVVRYGKSRFKKKRKQIPSHFATQKKAGASKVSALKRQTYGKKGGATGFIPGAQRRIKPYTKIRRKKKKGGKRPKRVSPYKQKGGEMFNVWDAQEYARNRATAFPSIGDQLDMQYHDLLDGTTTWKDAIAKVKSDNPKE